MDLIHNLISYHLLVNISKHIGVMECSIPQTHSAGRAMKGKNWELSFLHKISPLDQTYIPVSYQQKISRCIGLMEHTRLSIRMNTKLIATPTEAIQLGDNHVGLWIDRYSQDPNNKQDIFLHSNSNKRENMFSRVLLFKMICSHEQKLTKQVLKMSNLVFNVTNSPFAWEISTNWMGTSQTKL